MWKVGGISQRAASHRLTCHSQTRCFAIYLILDFYKALWNATRSLLGKMGTYYSDDSRAARW